MGKLTYQDISKRMTGVAFIVAFALLTHLLAKDISTGARGLPWTGFWLAALGASIPTGAGAFLQQIHQDEGTSREVEPSAVLLGLALGAALVGYVFLRNAEVGSQMLAVGAMFGFWVGAGLGTVVALLPRWANAPLGDESDRWLIDPPE
jgi:uncharacterized membrane protein